MIITLLGMSGAGKSYWSKRIAKLGYEHLDADAMIEARLGPQLTALGYQGINDVSKWMGQPYEDRYSRTSQEYSKLEHDVMRDILSSLAVRDSSDNVVIDTTGSVIYQPQDILEELGRRSTIVYLHTAESEHAAMAQLYLQDPKPVLWGNMWEQHPGETPTQALARCYPELLKARTAIYQRLAHVTLRRDLRYHPDTTAQTIIDAAVAAAEDARV